MTNEQIKQLRTHFADYLTSLGRDMTKHKFQCINPKHNDGTPSMKYYPAQHNVYCFGCRQAYDLFSAIEIFENLDKASAFKRAIELYAKNLGEAVHKPKEIVKQELTELKDRTNWYARSHKNFAKIEGSKEYLNARGMTDDVIKRFNLGAGTLKFGKKDFRFILIPVTPTVYIARNLDEGEPKYYRTKGSQIQIFNQQALTNEAPYCFVTEGEFDALSFERFNANAIALSSVVNVKKFIEAEKDLSKTYILALDNDEAGQEATTQLKDYLSKENIKFKDFDMPGAKDPNEALVRNPGLFEQSIKNTIAKTRRSEYEAS